MFANDGVSVVAADDGVLTLTFDRGEMRINPTSIALLRCALDTVEQAPHPKALVVAGTGKFFCNGLDIDWMSKNPEGTTTMMESFCQELARLLSLGCPTVCAITGHGFGAGLFIALACDWRVMRNDKAWVNCPELNLGMRLSKGFAELLKAKLTAAALRIGVLTGKRFTSSAALAAGIVDAECPEAEVVPRAHQMALELLPMNLKLMNFKSESLTKMKIELYTDAYRALRGPNNTPAHARL